MLPLPLPSISLTSLAVLVLHPGSFSHLLIKRCVLASEHSVPLFGVGSVDVRLCSLCVPAFCATPAFLSMTGCRKGLFGPVLTPFWVWDGQRDPAYPYTAKMQVREKCSQVGEEMALFSVPPPIWFLVATRAFTGAMHLLCHTTVSIQVSFVFLAWSVLKYLSGVGK